MFSRNKRRVKVAKLTDRLTRRRDSLDDESPRTATSMITADAGESLGCKHYRRRCKIRAPCCQEVFPCRLCHDEVKDDPLKIDPANITDIENMHKLPRHLIESIICLECDTEQPVAEVCSKCLVPFAAYYCATCKFWDDDLSKQIFHCQDCGICRVGGRENYFHCKVCDACYPLIHQGNHKCLAKAMKDVCCVCHETMFDSTKSVVILVNCGHAIHAHCLKTYRKTGTEASHRCPLCGVPDSDLAAYLKAMAEAEWETVELLEGDADRVILPEQPLEPPNEN